MFNGRNKCHSRPIATEFSSLAGLDVTVIELFCVLLIPTTNCIFPCIHLDLSKHY